MRQIASDYALFRVNLSDDDDREKRYRKISLKSPSLFPLDWELIGCVFMSVFYNCKCKFYPDGTVRQIASEPRYDRPPLLT